MAIAKSTRSAARFAQGRARGRSQPDRHGSRAKRPSRGRGKDPAKQLRDLFARCVHLRALFDAIDSLDRARGHRREKEFRRSGKSPPTRIGHQPVKADHRPQGRQSRSNSSCS